MRRSAVVLLALLSLPSSAAAAPVLVLGHHGRAKLHNDPFVRGPALTPAPARRLRAALSGSGAQIRPAARIARVTGHRKRRRPERTVLSELARLYHGGAITRPAYRQDSSSFNSALATERRLGGTRRTELTAVTENLHEIAAAGELTPSRLPALFQTVDRNRQWWTRGPLLASGQRVEFAGSQLLWEYYPGQGIELQMLGNFGKANSLYGAGRADYPALQQLLAELIPLAAQRGHGLAWEYYFNFDGGRPPWTSAMSQATGLEALSRAYVATRNPFYLGIAAQALPLLNTPPPTGAELPTPLGRRFLQYTFAPGASIINAFLQTLIGLDTYARVSANPLAARLFAAGDAEARAELPSFDTGAWSLYQPGAEDSLSYHVLVTGFLGQLCALTHTPVYCTTAQHFQAYLTTPPALQQLTFRGRAKRAQALRFRLSKYSHVGITISLGTSTRFLTSMSFPYGTGSFMLPGLRQAGTYGVTLTATDLAGNFTRVTGTLRIAR